MRGPALAAASATVSAGETRETRRSLLGVVPFLELGLLLQPGLEVRQRITNLVQLLQRDADELLYFLRLFDRRLWRHGHLRDASSKSSALSRLAGKPLGVSLKCEPPLAEQLREVHAAVIPGHLLNKRHWTTVIIDGSLPDAMIGEMVEDSCDPVNLVDRGLDPEQAILFVIDGGKALRRAIKDVFSEHALVHPCHRQQGMS